MVLLHFFQRFAQKRYGCEFAVAHIDHGLREESEAQADRLQAYCTAEQIPFYRERLCFSQQTAVEARARDARYEALFQFASLYEADALCTAHHGNDQLETLLMQWIRGNVSLTGIRPLSSRALPVLRPLLEMPREELEAYHHHHGLFYLEDPSNRDTALFRNRLRHEVLPLLLKENPRLISQSVQTALVRQQEQDYLREQAHSLYLTHRTLHERETTKVCDFPVVILQQQHPALQRLVLKEILTQMNGRWRRFTRKHVEAILSLCQAETRKHVTLPFAIRVTRKKQSLRFEHMLCMKNVQIKNS